MNQQEHLWQKQNVELFQVVCPSKVATRLANGRELAPQAFSKGEYIYQPDDPAITIFLLEEGRVKVGTFSDAGREIIKGILKPGDVFGELVILGEHKRRDYAVAMDPHVKVCALSVSELKSLMVEDPDFGMRIAQMIGLRLERTERRLESLVFKDAKTRVIDFLLDLARKGGPKMDGEPLVLNFFTHRDIASLTATSRQTVTSILNDLREHGIISFDRKKVEIHSLTALRNLL